MVKGSRPSSEGVIAITSSAVNSGIVMVTTCSSPALISAVSGETANLLFKALNVKLISTVPVFFTVKSFVASAPVIPKSIVAPLSIAAEPSRTIYSGPSVASFGTYVKSSMYPLEIKRATRVPTAVLKDTLSQDGVLVLLLKVFEPITEPKESVPSTNVQA